MIFADLLDFFLHARDRLQFGLNVLVTLEDLLLWLDLAVDKFVNFVELLHGLGIGALQFEQTGLDTFVARAILAQLLQIESIQILVFRLIANANDAVGVANNAAQKLIERMIRVANNQYLRIGVHQERGNQLQSDERFSASRRTLDHGEFPSERMLQSFDLAVV